MTRANPRGIIATALVGLLLSLGAAGIPATATATESIVVAEVNGAWVVDATNVPALGIRICSTGAALIEGTTRAYSDGYVDAAANWYIAADGKVVSVLYASASKAQAYTVSAQAGTLGAERELLPPPPGGLSLVDLHWREERVDTVDKLCMFDLILQPAERSEVHIDISPSSNTTVEAWEDPSPLHLVDNDDFEASVKGELPSARAHQIEKQIHVNHTLLAVWQQSLSLVLPAAGEARLRAPGGCEFSKVYTSLQIVNTEKVCPSGVDLPAGWWEPRAMADYMALHDPGTWTLSATTLEVLSSPHATHKVLWADVDLRSLVTDIPGHAKSD